MRKLRTIDQSGKTEAAAKDLLLLGVRMCCLLVMQLKLELGLVGHGLRSRDLH